MSAILKWLLKTVVLDWLFEKIKGLIEGYMERKRKERQREEDNKKAEEKLEKAETEQEIIDAGSDLLKR